MKSFFIILISIVLFSNCFSQDNVDSAFSNIPPLQVLIDSALEHSPVIKSQDAEVLIKEYNLSITRQQWLNYVQVIGDSKYGTYDNLIVNQYQTSNQSTAYNTSNVGTRLQIGLSLRFSIFDFIKAKNNKKIAIKELEQSVWRKEELNSYLRQTVIKQYHEVLMNHSLLKVKTDFLQQTKLAKDFSEKDYKSNIVEYFEVVRAADAYQKAMTDYEKTKTDFIVALLLLQDIVGINLSK